MGLSPMFTDFQLFNRCDLRLVKRTADVDVFAEVWMRNRVARWHDG